MYRTLIAATLALFPLTSSAADPDPRPANVRCEEYGKIAEEMTQLIFITDATHILKAMAQRYPASKQYHGYILNVVITPPITEGKKLHQELTVACMKQETKEL